MTDPVVKIDPTTITGSPDRWPMPFNADPDTCMHRWEFHLWEPGQAYCPECGSFARALNDPRIKPRRT